MSLLYDFTYHSLYFPVVLFPTRLSPKLPVVNLVLDDSPTTEQEVNTEEGKSKANKFLCFMFLCQFLALTVQAQTTLNCVGATNKGTISAIFSNKNLKVMPHRSCPNWILSFVEYCILLNHTINFFYVLCL